MDKSDFKKFVNTTAWGLVKSVKELVDSCCASTAPRNLKTFVLNEFLKSWAERFEHVYYFSWDKFYDGDSIVLFWLISIVFFKWKTSVSYMAAHSLP